MMKSVMIMIACIVLSLSIPAVTVTITAPDLSPSGGSGDCMSVIYGMSSCISYVVAGSNDSAPTKECCSAVKDVVGAGEDCICTALHSSSDLGFQLDMGKVLSLPTRCAVPFPSLSQACHLSLAPAPSVESGSPTAAVAASPKTAAAAPSLIAKGGAAAATLSKSNSTPLVQLVTAFLVFATFYYFSV